ncbi:MAG: hypothetical protein ACTSQE_16375 [Candidatus Heimdallarchaeaceae archaeon]
MNSLNRSNFESDFNVEIKLRIRTISSRLFWFSLIGLLFCLIMVGTGYYFKIYNQQIIRIFTNILVPFLFLFMISLAIFLITDDNISKIIDIYLYDDRIEFVKRYKKKKTSIFWDSIIGLKYRELKMTLKNKRVEFTNYKIKIIYTEQAKRKKYKHDLFYTSKDVNAQKQILERIEESSGVKKEKLWSPKWIHL